MDKVQFSCNTVFDKWVISDPSWVMVQRAMKVTLSRPTSCNLMNLPRTWSTNLLHRVPALYVHTLNGRHESYTNSQAFTTRWTKSPELSQNVCKEHTPSQHSLIDMWEARKNIHFILQNFERCLGFDVRQNSLFW